MFSVKKLFKRLFNLATYLFIFWSVFSATYLALPVEYQEMIPFVNEAIVIVSGVSTLLLGSGGLTVLHFLSKTEDEGAKKHLELLEQLVMTNKRIDVMENAHKKDIKGLAEAVRENTKVNQAQLELKLDNKFITDQAREVVEKIMSGGGENVEETNGNL